MTRLMILVVALSIPMLAGPAPAQTSQPTSRPAVTDAKTLSEAEKVDALIAAIAGLQDAVFLRNGEAHDAQAAADHLQLKLDFARDRIDTAEQFIRELGTRSSRSGREYIIQFDNGRKISCAAYLMNVLAQLEQGTMTIADNPAAPGFDDVGSDDRAIGIADATMQAMGGRAAWDETRYITWRFFGGRRHVWDKQTGDLRVEYDNREGVHHVLLTNLDTGAGQAWVDGERINDAEQLSGLMQRARSMWINDSYWLVMPYKLKDSGVTLTYRGEEAMLDERAADVLRLTFLDVGDTPQNMYDVFVAKDSGLVEQWSFYRTAADIEPAITNAWHNWKQYGSILLSDDRGIMRGNPVKHTEVAVFETLPRSIFEKPDPIDWAKYIGAAPDGE